MGKVFVVGIGPGNPEYTTKMAMDIIKNSDVLIGYRRALEPYINYGKKMIELTGKLEDLKETIGEYAKKEIAILVTGDTGIFSLAKSIPEICPDAEFIPGISSLQYLCAKTKQSWNDAAIVSIHGKTDKTLADKIAHNHKTIIFCGVGGAGELCNKLCEYGYSELNVMVGENLSYENEQITSGKVWELAELSFSNTSIALVENPNLQPDKINILWDYLTPGLPDEMFLRDTAPMTKEEVRGVVMSKLRLKPDSIIVDIGAGTGSVTVESALLANKGRVYAIEQKPENIQLIEKNIEKFALKNVQVIQTVAPDKLEDVSCFDRLFIGGSGDKLDAVIKWATRNENLRLVITAITIETAYNAVKSLEEYGYENIDIVNMQISRGKKAGKSTLMLAQNPIYIISAQKGRI